MNRAESARLLVLVCAVWGLSFPATDFALHYFDPFFILVGRFLIATVLLGAALLYTGKFHFTKNELKAGLITGSVFFVCVLTQIIGQLTVNPSSSAFITSLFVIFVPLLLALQHRRVPSGTGSFYAPFNTNRSKALRIDPVGSGNFAMAAGEDFYGGAPGREDRLAPARWFC